MTRSVKICTDGGTKPPLGGLVTWVFLARDALVAMSIWDKTTEPAGCGWHVRQL